MNHELGSRKSARDGASPGRRGGDLVALASFLVLCLCGGCGTGYTMRLSASDIEQTIGRRLPLSASKFLVTATVPKVAVEIRADRDRVLLRPEVDVAVAGQTALHGWMVIEGEVRYAAETGALFLDDAKMVEVSIQGLPASLRPVVEEVVAKLGLSYLASTPLYRLDPNDFKQALTKLVLRSVRARRGRLEVVFGV